MYNYNQNKKNHHEYLHELIKFKDPIECQWSDPADKLTTPVRPGEVRGKKAGSSART